MSNVVLHPSHPVPIVEAPTVPWPRRAERGLVRVFDALQEWHERSLARRRLAAMDDRMLADIGIDRGAVAAEVDKPFWRG